MSMRSSTAAALIAAFAVLGVAAGAGAQSAGETARQFAPSGKLRVGVLMLSYFAVEQDGQLTGWSPDLGIELARRLGMAAGSDIRRATKIHAPDDRVPILEGGTAQIC